MWKRGFAILIFLVTLVPSAQFAWQNRDMPEFADLHDDGILFVSAKSMALGHGYRIASLPENPYQTKYPPLYPWLLSFIWKANPNFPGNLQLATFFCWAVLAVCLWLALRFFASEPMVEKQRWWLLGILGLCPYMVLFGARMFTEIAFTCFVLGTLLSLRRAGPSKTLSWLDPWLILAGLLAAAAYLTRTAGIALIGSSLVLITVRRQWRAAGTFAAITFPAMLGWTLWTHLHLFRITDLSLMYYVDYLGFQRFNVGWDNFAVVLWKNTDQILYAMGSLVLPKVFDSLVVKILTQVIAVAMISGIVRLVRQGRCADYAWFALFSCLILVVWHYPPNERFLLPLYPLLLTGLWIEMKHLWYMLRGAFDRPKWGDRIVAAGFGSAVAFLLLGSLGLEFFLTFYLMQESMTQKREKLAERRAAYSWMQANLPASAAVFSYDDPLLYLYSGHRGSANPLLPRYWYAEDHKSIVNSYRNIAEFCQRRGLSYVYFTSEDALRETGEDDRKAIEALIRTDPNLEPVHSAGIGTVFRVNPHRVKRDQGTSATSQLSVAKTAQAALR